MKKSTFNSEDYVPKTVPECAGKNLDSWLSRRSEILYVLESIHEYSERNNLLPGPIDEQEEIAWHYTYGQDFIHTMTAGNVRAITYCNERRRGEFCYTFFTKNQKWEPAITARRYNSIGRNIVVGKVELFNRECGLFRFGYPVSKLLPWKQLLEEARCEGSTAPAWSHTRWRKAGALPDQWMGNLESVEIEDMIIEAMCKGKWVRLKELPLERNVWQSDADFKEAA